jgi:G:T-mismatch repair DNA endonuclease (very short patch repair protein)
MLHYQRTLKGIPLDLPLKGSIKFCTIEKCGKKIRARGYCTAHYSKWKKYGNPLTKADPIETSKKLSKIRMGHTVSKETREKLSKAHTGKVLSEKHIENLRISHRGKKLSESQKKKISQSNKGRIVTKETRKKISEKNLGRKIGPKGIKNISIAQKKRFARPEEKEKSRIRGKEIMSRSEVIKKISQSQRIRQAKPEVRKKMSETTTRYFLENPEQKVRMREQRAKMKFPSKDSKPEILTQSILKEHKIKFKKHHSFKLSDSYHQADILVEPNYIIEVFGDYWHCNPKKYDGESNHKTRRKEIKVKEVWKYDKYVIDGMKNQGYKVLVVWESELKDELEKITKKILRFIKT